jgi:hypothetical protein
VILFIFVPAVRGDERSAIGCFVVSVEGIDEVLTTNSVTSSVIVEMTDTGDFVSGSVIVL